MKSILEEFGLSYKGDQKAKAFVPKARYYSGMDFLLYLNEDCSYRADRVDSSLTLLWHPSKDKLVGLKLKGFLAIFKALSEILESESAQSIPVVKMLRFLEYSLEKCVADGALERFELERLRERYEKAIEFSESEHVTAEPVLV
jgi:hypothetical protein